MRVENIKTAKKISEHLHEIGEDIQAQDLLKIIRILSSKGKELGGDYYYRAQDKLCFTEANQITNKEFSKILKATEGTYPSIENIIDGNFTREMLIDKLSKLMKVKRSTTKRELLYKVQNEEILYELFKNLIIKKKCLEWKKYIENKSSISSQDKEHQIIFSEKGHWPKSLSNSFTQFWILQGNSRNEVNINDYQSKEYEDNLFLNMKDNDKFLLKLIKEMARRQNMTKDDHKFQLNIWEKRISQADLGLAEEKIIGYENDIDKLTRYFGRRRGSKFETFSFGLKQMVDKNLVKKLLGKKFLISTYSGKIFMGTVLDKSSFEKIASYLKIEYVDERNIISKVQDKETKEVISAIWQMSADRYKGFQMRALDKRRNKKC